MSVRAGFVDFLYDKRKMKTESGLIPATSILGLQILVHLFLFN